MADKYVNRVKVRYGAEVVPALIKTFGYKNVMQVPRLEKITINMRLGDIKDNAKSIQAAVNDNDTAILKDDLNHIGSNLLDFPNCHFLFPPNIIPHSFPKTVKD